MTLRQIAPLGALLLALTLTACDSGGPDDVGSTDPATLRLDVEAMTAGDAFAPGQPFAVGGTTGQLDRAQMILSGITLLHEDGREIVLLADDPVTVRAKDDADNDVQHELDERYVFVDLDAGRAPAMLGEAPAGRYTGVRFLLGVSGLDNRIATEDLPSGHPLADAAAATMHWNWNAGFVFLQLDGLLDVDGDGSIDASTGQPRDPASGQWRLHVGGTPNATTVSLDTDFELAGGTMQDLHLVVDLADLYRGLDLSDASERWCMTGGCGDVVSTATSNLSSAFMLHGVHGHDM